jgi:excisionase family DNA binding protein
LSDRANPLDCDKVDGQLEEVLKLLNSSPPYGTVASRVRRFVEDHAFSDIGPGSVFVPQWETDWKEEWVRFPKGQPPFDARYVVVAEGLEPAQKQALCSVCEAMLRLLFDSSAAYHKEKHLAGLREALREYLSLRGYDVTIPKGAGEDAPKTPPGPAGGPEGPTPSGAQGAKQESPLDEAVGYVWMNASEAARYFGTTDKTIREWIVDHKLTTYGEDGNSYKFQLKELEAKKAVWCPRRGSKAGDKRQSN